MLLILLAATVAATMPIPVKKWIIGSSAVDAVGMSASREGSSVRAELTVDGTGQPVHCEVTLPDKVAAYNRAACRVLMQTPHLAPARDADSNPIAAVLRYDITSEPIRTHLVRSAPQPPRDEEAKRRLASQRTVDFAIPVSRLPEPGKTFTTVVVLLTDDTGHVSTCDVSTPSGAAELDRLACSQMRATAFDPARDGQGQPLRAVREVSVGFVVGGAAGR